MGYIKKQFYCQNDFCWCIRSANVDDARELIKYYNFVAGETDYLNFGKDEFNISLEKEEEYIQDIFND